MSKSARRRSTRGRYNAYRITSPAHATKIVFAAGVWSAVSMLLEWRKANGIGEEPFALDPRWAASLTGVARQHVDEACAMRRLGIGVCYRADLGWGVGGPDDEREEAG